MTMIGDIFTGILAKFGAKVIEEDVYAEFVITHTSRNEPDQEDDPFHRQPMQPERRDRKAFPAASARDQTHLRRDHSRLHRRPGGRHLAHA